MQRKAHATQPNTPPVKHDHKWLRQQIAAAAADTTSSPLFPLTKTDYLKCSDAIAKLGRNQGPPLQLPSHALPPLP